MQKFLYPDDEELPQDIVMPIWDHLEELRERVLVALLACGVSIGARAWVVLVGVGGGHPGLGATLIDWSVLCVTVLLCEVTCGEPAVLQLCMLAGHRGCG